MAIAWPTTGSDVAASLKWAADRAAELEDYALAAVSKIEEKVGPWHGQVLTHRFHATVSFQTMQLPWPIGDVPTITCDGAAVTASAADLDTGVVYGDFTAGAYVVTVNARPAATCPPDVKLASRKLAAHLAKQELVGPRQPGQVGAFDKDLDVHQGYALPRAVSELIADYVPPGSFA